jgi:hypothetical protein
MIQTIYQIGFFAFFLFSVENTRLLALVSLSYLPAYFFYVRWLGIFSLKWQLPAQKAMIEQYTVLVEILLNIPTIKAFNGYKAASLSFLAQVTQARHRVFQTLFHFFRIPDQSRCPHRNLHENHKSSCGSVAQHRDGRVPNRNDVSGCE